MRQNPFSLYDFFGYFVPGALFVYSLMAYYGWKNSVGAGWSCLIQPESQCETHHYIMLVLVAYITGHLLSFISSVSIERYTIFVHGYPSKYLFDEEQKPLMEEKTKLKIVLFLIGTATLLPISILDLILGKMLRVPPLYPRSMNKLLREHMIDNVNRLLLRQNMITKDKLSRSEIPGDLFLYLYHFALENSENHKTKMQNYVALYGFTRQLSLIFVGSFWLSIIEILSGDSSKVAYLVLGGSILLSYGFYLAFNKFYRRFSQEAIFGAVVSWNRDADGEK